VEEWPEAADLPHYKLIKNASTYTSQLREKFNRFPSDAVDLLDGLLCLIPAKRPTAAEALRNPWLESGDKARPLALHGGS